MKIFFTKMIFAVFLLLCINKTVHAQSLVRSIKLDSNYQAHKPVSNSNGDIFLPKIINSDTWFMKYNADFELIDSARFEGGMIVEKFVVTTNDTIIACGSDKIVKWKFKSYAYVIKTDYEPISHGGLDFEVSMLEGIKPDTSSNGGEIQIVDIDIDKNKNIYVLISEGYTQSKVYKYNSNFKLLSSFKHKPTLSSNRTDDIAVDKFNGSIYLLNTDNSTGTGEITKYNSSGVKVKSVYPTISYGHLVFELELDNQQALYFTSIYSSNGMGPYITRILKYSPKADPLSSYTLPVSGFNSNVTINPSGNFLMNTIISTKIDSIHYTYSFELREYTLKQNSFVTYPANEQVAVNPNGLKVLLNKMSGATSYSLQISLDSSFASAVTLSSSVNSFSPTVTYGKKYFVRASSSLNPEWGPEYTFTTIGSESITYVNFPVDKAVNVSVSTTIRSTANPLATSYTFQVSTDSAFVNNVLTKSSATTSIAMAGLLYNQTYYTRVSTNNAPDKWGKITSFKTLSADKASAITSPVNGKTDMSPINLKITCSVISGASSYQFDVSADSSFRSGFDTTYSKTVATNTATFTELTYGRMYYCRVKTNISGYSKVSIFSTIDAYKVTKITSPANNAALINPMSVKITAANIMGGASVYVFELSPDSSFATNTYQVSTANSTTFTNLNYNTKYFVRVRTNISQTIPSPVVCFTTASLAEAASIYSPKNNSVSVSTSPKLYSNIVSGATLYTIQISVDSSFLTNTHTLSSANAFATFSNLLPNTVYFARVKTNLDTANWGGITKFQTIGTTARIAGVSDELTVQTNTFNIFPNPSEGVFTVYVRSDSMYAIDYIITGISGEILESGYLRSNENNSVGDALAPGTYFLCTQTSDGKKIIKLIKL